ncbi:putative ankyrin repeat protein RF_0381 [Chrysoperla carnea]|uniref:putative ankyrin repeat protein RF_0381 n=1 Tax=Chrysoperla carnea TaxID=189513 RepID=UPI001D05E008|nr:putative ankyrin repeat protein RF_0381 [Chrysoperla carnea]
MLVEGGADIDRVDQDWIVDDGTQDYEETLTPLQIALDSSNMEIVSYLLDKVQFRIHRLAEWGTVEIIEKFIKPTDINSVDEYLRTPLFYSVKKPVNLKYLISLGSNINHHDEYDKTPVFVAMELGNLESVKILIKENCNLNFTVKNGNTPLEWAINVGNFELFKLLVDGNASVTMRDPKCQWTLLHHAVLAVYDDVTLNMMQYLLLKGAEINATNIYGETPLYLAVDGACCNYSYVSNKSYKYVKFLLDNGAELNTLINEYKPVNRKPPTPISIAVMKNNYKLVKLLILYGADLYLDRNLINLCEDAECRRLLSYAGLRFNNVPIIANDSSIENLIKHIDSNPFDLKSLCRITLRKTLGKNYLCFINSETDILS